MTFASSWNWIQPISHVGDQGRPKEKLGCLIPPAVVVRTSQSKSGAFQTPDANITADWEIILAARMIVMAVHGMKSFRTLLFYTNIVYYHKLVIIPKSLIFTAFLGGYFLGNTNEIISFLFMKLVLVVIRIKSHFTRGQCTHC